MRLHILAGFLAFLLVPGSGLHLHAQDKQPANPGRAVEFKGIIKLSSHSAKLEKGATYRITVKAEGFEPTLRIMGDFGSIANTTGNDSTAHLIFTPFETRDYKLVVDFNTYGKIEKKANSYVLTVEKAKFEADTNFKDPLKLNETTIKMAAGKIYAVSVTAKDFHPAVPIVLGDKSVMSADSPSFGGAPGKGIRDQPVVHAGADGRISHSRDGEPLFPFERRASGLHDQDLRDEDRPVGSGRTEKRGSGIRPGAADCTRFTPSSWKPTRSTRSIW